MKPHKALAFLPAMLLAALTLSPGRCLAKSFFQQLLESGSSSNSNDGYGGGSAYQQLQDRQQTLMEDEQRLDAAYSALRQKQAAGQDTTAEQAQVQHYEQAYLGRKQEVRQLQMQVQREQQFQQMQQMNQMNQPRYDQQRLQQQLDEAYYQMRQKEAAGYDTTEDRRRIRYMQQQLRMNQNNGFGNNGWQDDDSGNSGNQNQGFSINFG